MSARRARLAPVALLALLSIGCGTAEPAKPENPVRLFEACAAASLRIRHLKATWEVIGGDGRSQFVELSFSAGRRVIMSGAGSRYYAEPERSWIEYPGFSGPVIRSIPVREVSIVSAAVLQRQPLPSRGAGTDRMQQLIPKLHVERSTNGAALLGVGITSGENYTYAFDWIACLEPGNQRTLRPEGDTVVAEAPGERIVISQSTGLLLEWELVPTDGKKRTVRLKSATFDEPPDTDFDLEGVTASPSEQEEWDRFAWLAFVETPGDYEGVARTDLALAMARGYYRFSWNPEEKKRLAEIARLAWQRGRDSVRNIDPMAAEIDLDLVGRQYAKTSVREAFDKDAPVSETFASAFEEAVGEAAGWEEAIIAVREQEPSLLQEEILDVAVEDGKP